MNHSVPCYRCGSRVNIRNTFLENPTMHFVDNYMSRVVRKPDFGICENKDAGQLRGDLDADQRLWFRYIYSTIPLLPKSESSSL